jgi:hypothetical protein
MRNWGIRNLRALYALSYQISGERGAAIRALIDEELVARGALTDAAHSAAVGNRIFREIADRRAGGEDDDLELPF